MTNRNLEPWEAINLAGGTKDHDTFTQAFSRQAVRTIETARPGQARPGRATLASPFCLSHGSFSKRSVRSEHVTSRHVTPCAALHHVPSVKHQTDWFYSPGSTDRLFPAAAARLVGWLRLISSGPLFSHPVLSL
jgi:hypothetical protein